ncbi:MAG: arsenate reductase (thioredoxin) [Bacillota bacterium]
MSLKRKVLFLCTGNSCRSQMAEGFLRALGGDKWEAYSAGLDPRGVNPRAIEAMKEVGIDISHQTSKGIDPRLIDEVDMVITLCGSADEACPVTPPHVRRIHWPLEDPARATGTPGQVLNTFRRVRDEIRRRVEGLAT